MSEIETKLREVLAAYEQWEADVIMQDDSWRIFPLVLQPEQFNRLIELQQMRNAVLYPEKEENYRRSIGITQPDFPASPVREVGP